MQLSTIQVTAGDRTKSTLSASTEQLTPGNMGDGGVVSRGANSSEISFYQREKNFSMKKLIAIYQLSKSRRTKAPFPRP